jgi:uncharacterized membrane protein
MKRFLIVGAFLLSMLILVIFPLQYGLANQPVDQSQQSYEKWGRMAVLVTKEAFPDSDVSDYQYIGREEKIATTA